MRIALLCLAMIAGGTQLLSIVGSYFKYQLYLGDYRIFWLAGWLPLSRFYVDLNLLPFPYPPTTIFLVKPFGLLPFWWSFTLWVGSGFLVTILAMRRIVPLGAVALSLLTVAFFGVLIGGQTSLFISALVIGGILSRDERLAGAFFGLAGVLKPQSMIALPFALLGERRWKAIAWTGAVAIVVVLLSLLAFGLDLWIRWFFVLDDFRAQLHERDLDWKDVGLYGLMLRLGLPSWLYAIGWPLGIAAAYLTWRGQGTAAERYAAIACASVLLSPYTLAYDLAGLSIVSVAMLLDDRRKPLEWVAAASIAGQVLPVAGIVLMAGCLTFRYRLPGRKSET